MRKFNSIMMERSFTIISLSFLIFAGFVYLTHGAQASAPAKTGENAADKVAEVIFNESKVIAPVNRRIMGQNILAYQGKRIYSMKGAGLWDPIKAAPVPEMISLLKESGAKTLRWPGGCESHVYNWKLTVGPLSKRPTQAFGLPEFLKCCAAIGAEPIITLGDYWGSPMDFADIVEYLNSPVGKNPNGGTDWAEVRAKDGHPEPYNVVWFEYGNESNHGPHCKTKDVWYEYCCPSNPTHKSWTRDAWYAYTPAQYSELYRKVQKAMKAVDPKIKLGAVLGNEAQPLVWHDWTYDVVRLTGAYADFYITHIYMLGYNLKNGKPSADKLFQLAFTSARQTELVLANLSRYIKRHTRRDIPLAITEFNCGLDQEMPVPYRFCQGAAVQVAEIVLTMMTHSKFNVNNAQYWQFSNEHWGMISNFKYISGQYKKMPALIKRPVFLAYALCNKYLGDSFVKSSVSCGTYSTNGGFFMQPATGSPMTAASSLVRSRRAFMPNWKITPSNEYETKANPDGSLSVKILDNPLKYCNAQFYVPTRPLVNYRISAEIKTDGNPNIGVKFEVGDGRGWNTFTLDRASKSSKTTKWHKVSRDYESLYNAKNLAVRMKCEGKNLKLTKPFSFSVRRFAIQEIGVGQDLGRIPYVQVYASRSSDGGLKLILANRNISSSIKVKIKGMKGKVTVAETLCAPSVDSTNEDMLTCKILPLKYSTTPDGILVLTLPPHSLSGVATD